MKRMGKWILVCVTLLAVLAAYAPAASAESEAEKMVFFDARFKENGKREIELYYNGKEQKPEFYVLDTEGNTVSPSRYTVTYDKGCKQPGMYHVYIEDKQGVFAKITLYIWIYNKETEYVEMEGNNKQVTLSWKAAAGANVYRVLIYDEKAGYYKEQAWPDGSLEYGALSYTFTDLTPGKTYKMAIKAHHEKLMPTDVKVEFTLTVPTTAETVKKVLVEPAKPTTTTKKTTTATKKTTQKTTATKTTTTAATASTTTSATTTTTAEATISSTETETAPSTTLSTTASTAGPTAAGTQPQEEKSPWLWIVLGSTAGAAIVAGGVYLVLRRKPTAQ